MQHVKIFIDLTRLNKPVGFMLLFWPCSWSLSVAYKSNLDTYLFIYYLILFFLGSVLMRSAGCIINDIVDRDYDKKVKRTNQRPLASGKISIYLSSFYAACLCGLAFIILIQFNVLTIILGMGSMIFAFTYPFMKRITYWPQLFLGFTFNWGIIMAWAAMNNTISFEIIILYSSAIFWTLGYDTIYGAQDMSDDEIIGIKSTSIKFKKNLKIFVFVAYMITILNLTYFFYDMIGWNIFSIFLICFFLSLIFQVYKFDKSSPKKCLQIFKSNNYSGLFLFTGILLIN